MLTQPEQDSTAEPELGTAQPQLLCFSFFFIIIINRSLVEYNPHASLTNLLVNYYSTQFTSVGPELGSAQPKLVIHFSMPVVMAYSIFAVSSVC
jgi:hypothetical protein